MSVRICQEGHANALALNKGSTQIAVAGRSLLKVYSIEPEGFLEVCNLRAGKNHNLSYSSNDVAWSHLEGSILATAATNGVVSVWDLSKFGRQKQLLTYNEHERTAHSVTFHPQEPHFLISGSQDGTIKRFDTRYEKSVTTFYSNSESVRDVKFSPQNPYIFAAASENGQVQLWDTRRTEKCIYHFTAHSEPIYTMEFHPSNHEWLATGSRDKQIKIWKLGAKGQMDPIYTIQTIAVVGRVRWRPEKPFHIASCALVMDYSIYIWDVRRPYIPYACFNEHTNVTTGIGFKANDPYCMLSTSKDSTIYKHSLRDASRSSMYVNPQGATMNFRGDILYAYKLKPPLPAIKESSECRKDSSHKESPEKSDLFHFAKSSLVWFPSTEDPNKPSLALKEYLSFKGLAAEYKLSGLPLAEMCDHNAEVAKKYGKHSISALWTWVKQFFASSADATDEKNGDLNGNHPGVNRMLSQNGLSNPSGIGWSEDKLAGHHHTDQWTKSFDRGLTALQSLDDKTQLENTLPKSFDHPNISGSSTNNLPGHIGDTDGVSGDFILFGERELTIDCVNMLRNGFLYTGDICKELVFPNALSSYNDLNSTKHSTEALTEPTAERQTNLLKVSVPPSPPLWEPFNVLRDCLLLQTDVGDVQTPVCILIAIGNKRAKLEIDESTHENWLFAYIEQLNRNQLWNEAAEIINFSWIEKIGAINEQSTSVHTNCGNCGKTMSSQAGWYCAKCKSSETSQCSVCQNIVRGLYTWCLGCSHGGHIQHIREWFTTNSKCPTCGHLCEYD